MSLNQSFRVEGAPVSYPGFQHHPPRPRPKFVCPEIADPTLRRYVHDLEKLCQFALNEAGRANKRLDARDLADENKRRRREDAAAYQREKYGGQEEDD